MTNDGLGGLKGTALLGPDITLDADEVTHLGAEGLAAIAAVTDLVAGWGRDGFTLSRLETAG
jgi:hypothetical protein